MGSASRAICRQVSALARPPSDHGVIIRPWGRRAIGEIKFVNILDSHIPPGISCLCQRVKCALRHADLPRPAAAVIARTLALGGIVRGWWGGCTSTQG